MDLFFLMGILYHFTGIGRGVEKGGVWRQQQIHREEENTEINVKVGLIRQPVKRQVNIMKYDPANLAVIFLLTYLIYTCMCLFYSV